MTLMSAASMDAPLVTLESGLMVAAGLVDRDTVDSSIVLLDSFNKGDDTILDEYNPTRGSWVHNTDTDYTPGGTATLQVGGGDGYAELTTTATTATYYLDRSFTDFDCTLILNHLAFANETQILFRSLLSARTGYMVRMTNQGKFVFGYVIAGVWTTLYDGPTLGYGPQLVRVKMVGDDYTVWEADIEDGDTPVDTGTDTTHQGAGYFQMYIAQSLNCKVNYVELKDLD